MSSSAINFFYQSMALPASGWKIFYDFSTDSGINVPSISGANARYSGVASSSMNTGVFTGQSIHINSGNEINANAWAMMIVFEKFNHNVGTLFSNYHEDINKSGFVLGVNSANKLYFETFDNFNNEPVLYESTLDLATRNAIILNRSDDRLEFSYFDFNSKNVTTDSFQIPTNTELFSNDWYLGKAINCPSYLDPSPFQGKMDYFLYTTGHIFPPQQKALFSGLTLSTAPLRMLGLLNENCTYSYLGLTGTIDNITFETIEAATHCVQTGYLLNQIGQLRGWVSGVVSGGFCTATGYISGATVIESGYTVSTTGFISGFAGNVEIGSGLRIFQNTIPSGASSTFVPFPSPFNNDPVIFTELKHASPILTHQISQVSFSGFSISFSNPVPSNSYVLTTMVAPAQTNADLKFFKIEIPPDTDNLYINFPFDPILNPKIFSQIENNTEQSSFSYNIFNISANGFNISFSDRIEFPGVILHTFVTNLTDNASFTILSTSLTSGTNGQLVNYSVPFSQPPIVFGEMINSSGEDIISHQISAVSSSNFTGIFSENLPSNNYILNSLSWSGVQSGIGYVYSTGKQITYLGQVTDVCENIYNLSGYQDALVITQYDLPIFKPSYFTGITGSVQSLTTGISTPIFVPVSYTIPLNSGQTATFDHQIVYQNDGSNSIRTNHTLLYSGSSVQFTPFTVYKFCFQNFGYILSEFLYDNNYIYTFGMDGVRYIKEIDQDDFSELYVFPQEQNKTNLNEDAVFDRSVSEFFTTEMSNNDDLNIYLNGLAEFGGGFTITGYNRGVKPYFDFVVTGNYLYSNNYMNGDDRVVFDIISGHRRYRNVPADYTGISGIFYLNNFNADNYGVYLDGVRLVSGLDYIEEGTNLKIINNYYNDITGFMFILPEDSDFKIKHTGRFDSLLTERFARGTSMLWGNGNRQNLDEQYIEISNMELLTGTRNFDESTFTIFNNDSMFWR